MARPILTRSSTAAARRSSTAGMRHTARRRLPNETRGARGRYRNDPTLGPPICCLLTQTEWTEAEIAASQGSKTKWEMQVPDGTTIPAGSEWDVTDGCWTETVEITGDLVKHGAVMRLVGAKDATLNKP